MKKLLTTIIGVLLITTTYAQSVSFGPKVGMNISKLTNIDSDEKLGLNVGMFFTGYFTSVLGIEVSAMFSQEGTSRSVDLPGFGNDIDVKTKLNFLNIPVVLKLNPIGGLNFFVGPQFGLLLSAKDKIGDDVTIKVKDEFHNANLSGVAGFGYRFIENIDISVSYNFMFTKTNKSNVISVPGGSISYEVPNMKGNTWQLTIGYAF